MEWILNKKDTKLMEKCEHGYKGGKNPYHLEGSVFTHTTMVFNEMKKLTTDRLLLAAAQLHDTGKPFARYEKESKVYFSGHEGISAYIALNYATKYKLNPTELFKLVALHGILYKYPKKQMIEASFDTDFWNKLSVLIKADHLGRITNQDKTGLLKLLNEKYDFEYIKNQNNKFLQYISVERKEVIVLIGPPNSGKSAYVNSINKSNKYKIISRDELILKYGKTDNYNKAFDTLTSSEHEKIDIELQNNYRTFLINKENIIIDMTNISPKSRRKWTNLIKRKEYKIKFVLFLKPFNTIMEINNKRGTKTMNKNTIIKFMSKFTYPLPYKEKFDSFKIVLSEDLIC